MGDYANNHILVTGSHRSGSTWVGRTIAQHPRLRYVHEPFNVEHPNWQMNLKLNEWFADYESSKQKQEIRDAFDILLQAGPLEYATQSCRAAGWDLITPIRFSRYLVSRSLLKPRILIKDPIALLAAGWLHETYNLQVVCIIRSPLAVVGSLKKAGWDYGFENLRQRKELMQGWLSPFTEEINLRCDRESDFIDRVSLLWNIFHYRIWQYQQMYPSWIFVKYENIAANPVLEFKKIFDSLGLEMNREIREYITQYTSSNNQKETNCTYYKPRDSQGSLETWKQRLSPEECDRVTNATQEIATLFYKDPENAF
jgi:hypothetical protein